MAGFGTSLRRALHDLVRPLGWSSLCDYLSLGRRHYGGYSTPSGGMATMVQFLLIYLAMISNAWFTLK